MTTPTCVTPGCDRPSPDAPACSRCGKDLAIALRNAAGHAEDAQAVIARQTRYGASHRRTTDDDGQLPNLTASATLHHVSRTTDHWANTLNLEPEPWRVMTGPLCPPARPGDPARRGNRCTHDSCHAIRERTPPPALAEALRLLARHIDDLRKTADAATAFHELHDACAQLARLVDRPATDRRLVGMCDCGAILYAPAHRPIVRCRAKNCGASWNVAESQEILLRHLDSKLVTAGEAAKLAAYLDDDRTQEQIRKLIAGWDRRALVVPHGQIWREPNAAELKDDPEAGPVAVPTYRFGEIRDRLARTPRRHREGAAA